MTYHYHTNHKVLLGDLHTPVSTYLKVRDLFPQSALMESSDYHGSENNRSFIGLNPIASISVSHDVATAIYPDHSREETPISEACTVEDVMNRFLARFRVEGEYADYCGVYGYTSFNAVRYFEPVEVKDSTEAKNDAPDILYILYKYIIVFNDFKSEMVLIEMNDGSEPSHIGEIERAIHDRNYTTYGFHPIGETTSTLTDEAHKANIRKGIAHCLRGDVFQIVLSRRFIQHFQGDDFKLYRALRSINPSPYLFYFDFGGFRIFGSSPETHCRIEDGQATIDPIAGTTRRSGWSGGKRETGTLNCSGAAYPGVAPIGSRPSSSGATSSEALKSITQISFSGVIITFSGFRSKYWCDSSSLMVLGISREKRRKKLVVGAVGRHDREGNLAIHGGLDGREREKNTSIAWKNLQ